MTEENLNYASVILCEGKIDHIVLSYWLGKKYDWEYVKKVNKKLIPDIQTNPEQNTGINWYKNPENRYLAIIFVGGDGGFDKYSNIILNYNKQEQNSNKIIFNKVIFITDKDNDSIEKRQNKLDYAFGELKNQELIHFEYMNELLSENKFNIEVGLIILPTDDAGCLETVLLKSLEQNTEHFLLIEKIRDFTDNNLTNTFTNKSIGFHDNIQKLSSREKIKLACFISILFPDRTFSPINKFLSNIKWENADLLDNYFNLLKDL